MFPLGKYFRIHFLGLLQNVCFLLINTKHQISSRTSQRYVFSWNITEGYVSSCCGLIKKILCFLGLLQNVCFLLTNGDYVSYQNAKDTKHMFSLRLLQSSMFSLGKY